MNTRYEAYNEITFEAYCKKSIDNAILKGRMEKAKRAAQEISLSALTDADLYKLYVEQEAADILEGEQISFIVNGIGISVHNLELGRALSYLPPKLRNVILLSLFLNMPDPEIARQLHTSRSSVQRRRVAALQRLKERYL